MISLLCPSRGRPEMFKRMARSAFRTAKGEIEILCYLDEDDPSRGDYFCRPGLCYVTGERITLSQTWNRVYENAQGPIFMHCGDDLVFRTRGWDEVVQEAFEKSESKILLVHGDDCSPNTDALATHGFLHRRWVEAVGYFLPPIFSSDWADVWLTEVADMLGVRLKVPIVTEHMHYSFGKAEYDLTHREREERGRQDGVVNLFKRTLKDRLNDAAKLKVAM